MRVLTSEERLEVSGGTIGGQIAFLAAGSWASTVAGAAVGGPVGALIGFSLSMLIGTGYIMAQK
jgi:hypothetical protein